MISTKLMFNLLPKQINARLVIPMYNPVFSVLGAGEGVTTEVVVDAAVVDVIEVHWQI